MAKEILSPKEKKKLDRLWEKQYGKLEDWLGKKPIRIDKKEIAGRKYPIKGFENISDINNETGSGTGG